MTTAVKFSGSFVRDAQKYARAYRRSVPKQIEYWSRIGKIAEENPNLPYSLIKDVLLSLEEMEIGDTTPYSFG